MQPFPTSPNAPSPSEQNEIDQPHEQPIHAPIPSEPIHAPLPSTPNPGGPANPDVPRIF